MPLISVLLPAKDAATYVGSAVATTLRAMPADSELILIDDGSTDETLEKAQRISDPRLRILQNRVPMGLAASLNDAIQRTDSTFIARMDADDICLPWRFRLQMRQIEQARLDALFASVLYMRPNGVVTRPDAPGSLGDHALSLSLLVGNSLVHPTLLARRTALERAGLFEDVRAEDYELWMRMSNNGARMARAALPALLYRKHSGQISSSDKWRATLAAEVRKGPIPDTHREFFHRLTGNETWQRDYLMAALRIDATDVSLELIEHVQTAARTRHLTSAERLYVAGRVEALRRYCLAVVNH